MAYNTLGDATVRKTIREESYAIAIGFTLASGQTGAENKFFKFVNDGTITAVSATTDIPAGRCCSAYTGNDANTARLVTPFEAHITCYADGVIDEGQQLACSGFDTTSMLPKFKLAVSGDWVSAVCIIAAASTTTAGQIGVLRCGYRLP